MISSKPRLVVPYGLKTLLEGVSRAILKTNPTNITQFAAVYFKELIVFREGNSSLDIKDLIKQFHQMKVEKWAEGVTVEKKECIKEPIKPPPVPCKPTHMEKSTDTEEDNVAGPLFSNKTTQFPSVHAEVQSEETSEGARGPSDKPTTPKTDYTPPSSPPPAPVSAEYAYVPADPAQFAAQMLGNVPSTYSEVLMVDVATSTPAVPQDVLSAEFAEEVVLSAPLVCSGETVEVQVVSKTSAQVVVGPVSEAEPPKASSAPLQGEQEPPAHEAPDTQVTSASRISSIYNDVPVNEGVVYVEEIPGYIVIPFTDHDQVACVKEIEQSPPGSPKAVEPKTKISIESLKTVQVEENPQATLYLPNPKEPQFLQNPPKVTSPTYVMMDDSKKTNAPPFILVGSNVQEAQDWNPLPGHAVVSQAEALKRYAAVQVPIAVPADQTFQRPAPNPQNASPPTSGQDGPRPKSPVFLSVAFPVEDVAKKSSGSGDKRTPFGSYGIAGEITVTTAHVRRAEP